MKRGLLIAATLAVGVTLVRADDSGPFTQRLVDDLRARIAELVAAKVPPLVPPTPVAVSWKAVKLGSLELGAPLLATAAADLDGDGLDELFAVTSEMVIAIRLTGTKPTEVGRVAFAGPRAVPAPRQPIGTAFIEAGELVAAASPWANELRITWSRGKLTGRAGSPGFGVCAGERLSLVPGRNYFAPDLLAVRCRTDLVDKDGVGLRLRAQLAGKHKLAVTSEQCRGAACEPPVPFEIGTAGAAFALADVDRNGTPEVIISGAGAPGDADAVKVIALGGDTKKGLFRKSFTGGVAAIEVVSRGPKDAARIIAAVRLSGATRIDLWRLN